MVEGQASAERRLRRLALGLGALFTLAIGAVYALFDHPGGPFALALREQSGMNPLPIGLALPAALAAGMGLGTLAALFWRNRHRLRAVFRPNFGRVISAAVLALLWPVWMFWMFPFAAAFVLGQAVVRFSQGRALPPEGLGFVLSSLAAAPVLSYVAACLIISGVARRWVRVALFGQVWIAAYAAALLIIGIYQGNM